jgi:(2Fe-2S) ferredoxin
MGKHDHEDVNIEQLIRRGGACLGICAGKHCARAGTKQVLRAVRAALDEAGLGEAVPVTLTKCQDYCDDGPVMTILPGAYPYINLRPDSARQVVLDHVRDGRPVLEQLHKRMRRKLARRLARAASETEPAFD